MAKRGTKKAYSVQQESYVAKQYGGTRSKSSGGAITDAGDVRVETDTTLIECKGKFGELTGDKPVRSTLVNQMEKAADEAWAEAKEPMLALRFYLPESVLASPDGYVDLSVRLLSDDVYRSDRLNEKDNPECPEDGVRWR